MDLIIVYENFKKIKILYYNNQFSLLIVKKIFNINHKKLYKILFFKFNILSINILPINYYNCKSLLQKVKIIRLKNIKFIL